MRTVTKSVFSTCAIFYSIPTTNVILNKIRYGWTDSTKSETQYIGGNAEISPATRYLFTVMYYNINLWIGLTPTCATYSTTYDDTDKTYCYNMDCTDIKKRIDDQLRQEGLKLIMKTTVGLTHTMNDWLMVWNRGYSQSSTGLLVD